jgi:hypothetical protein
MSNICVNSCGILILDKFRLRVCSFLIRFTWDLVIVSLVSRYRISRMFELKYIIVIAKFKVLRKILVMVSY